MSQENAEVIRAWYEAFNRRDFDQITTYAHTEFEIKPLPALIAMTGDQIKGYEEAKRFWSSFFEGFDEIQVEPRGEILQVGEMVVADLRWSGRGRNGIEVEQFHTDLWFFRDGRIARVEGFATRTEALEAAGLSA